MIHPHNTIIIIHISIDIWICRVSHLRVATEHKGVRSLWLDIDIILSAVGLLSVHLQQLAWGTLFTTQVKIITNVKTPQLVGESKQTCEI